MLRSWLRVLVVAGFAGAAAFTALALAPARYTATAEIRLPAPVSEEAVAATVAALQSADLARRLVVDLDLAQSPAFNGAFVARDVFGWLDRLSGRNGPRSAAARGEPVLAALRQSLQVAPGRESGLVTIRVTARTPELAARIADHLIDLQLAAAAPTGTVVEADTRAALDREIEQLSEDVRTIESEVARLTGPSGEAAQAERRADLAEALAQAERERGDAEARARAVRALLEKGKVEAIAELQTSPTFHQLIAERVRVEVQKNGAERTLPTDHPRIRDLQARLSELRWQMFREATAIAEALEVDVQTAAAREAEARARLESAEARARASADIAHDTGRRAALEQEVAAKRSALEALKARRAATTDAPLSPPAHTAPERVSSAQTVAIPAFPRKGQLALLTAVAVLMVGFVAVIVRTLLAGTRRSIAESGFADLAATARDRADVRHDALAHPPRPTAPRPGYEARAPGAADQGAAETPPRTLEPGQFVILSTTADAARHLAGRAVGQKGHRTLLVNDGIDGAGEAREIVSSLATAGRRCVLVDWARDGRGLAAALGAESRPGINDLLDGRAGFDDVIVRLPDSDAHFIAAGAPPADPARPLDANWINLVLDALDEAYDHIVIAAQLDEARRLFETIEGRFDAGIVMSDRRGQGPTINAGPGVFLGFEVTEIYIVQMDFAQRRGAARRLKRARRQVAA
ncbi:MAG: hypothetical protein ACK4TL_08180 [Hyphomicrobiaceae bacterium]